MTCLIQMSVVTTRLFGRKLSETTRLCFFTSQREVVEQEDEGARIPDLLYFLGSIVLLFNNTFNN